MLLSGCATQPRCYEDPDAVYAIRDEAGNVVRLAPMCVDVPVGASVGSAAGTPEADAGSAGSP